MATPHAFRREQIILPDLRLFSEAEEPWQTEYIFAPLDARDDSGEWLYRLLYYELPRGHAKSTVAAMEAIRVAMCYMDAWVYVAAADQEQGGIIFNMIRGMVKRNRNLDKHFKIGKYEATCKPTGSQIKVLTSDAPSTYGLGGIGRVYVFICDELWQWRGRELWDALYTATGKVKTWRGIVLSNAGFDFQSIAWETRELCRTSGPPFYLYAPDGVVASWLTQDWVDMQRVFRSSGE
jgi:phage terminase large subunit-like protein